MSHGKTALTLTMALALPGAAEALGLGEIHLDSALNEPLAVNIDLVGATAEDLAGITASIASRETFEHFGVDRSAFLSTVAFKISRDSTGRAILAIRSKDACTEPLLNMLVDLRWRGGDLIRQYTLLLDPPGFPSGAPAAAAVEAPASSPMPVSVRPAVSEALVETSKPVVEDAPASDIASTTVDQPAARKTIRVGAKATLRGVAWRVGSRSDADLKRMMIAIFRANPNAFEGNINRLRRGAVLTIPSTTEVSGISAADASHEVFAQMQAWHAATLAASASKPERPAVAAPVSSPRESLVPSPLPAGSADSAMTAPTGATIDQRSGAESAALAEAALDRKVEQLERGLDELRDQLDREHDALVHAQAQLTRAENAPAVVAPPQAHSGRGIGASIAALLALGASAFGIHAWRRRRAPASQHALVQVAAQGAVSEALAPSTPLPVEPHAARIQPQDIPPETHHAPPATPLQEEDGERQWVADALGRRRNSIAIEPTEADRLKEAVDAESLEASYLWPGSTDGLEDTVNLGDTHLTAGPSATVKLCVDDPGAKTMPIETARIVGIPASTTRERGAGEDTLPATKAFADTTQLDYNLLDLDATVQHVQMPSALHENVGFKERRTSLVDVLKSAVEREPHRQDLRMKLLETYYTAAATNRQGFLDFVRKIADERVSLSEGEWDRIAWMGRQIASDEALFAPLVAQADEEDLANCA